MRGNPFASLLMFISFYLMTWCILRREKAFSFYSLTSMRARCLNFYIWRGNYLDI